MSNWGWKQSAMFLVGLALATGALVAAGIAEATNAGDASFVTAKNAR